METILREREKQPFTSFEDLQKRTGLREPSKLVAKRVLEEISGESRVSLFVKRY
jgi:putative nucleotide binding protein